MAVSIKRRPSVSVSSLVLKRRGNGDRHIDATWKVPKDLTNQNKDNRAESLIVTWWLGIPGADPGDRRNPYGASATSSNMNIANFRSGSRSFNRQSFYPFTATKLDYVSFRVQPRNRKGMGSRYTHAAYWFQPPRRPTISAISFNSANGQLSCTITTDAGNDAAERYDTEYWWTIDDTRVEGHRHEVHSSDTSTSIALSYDVADYQSLGYDDHIRATCRARARGLRGDSAWVERTYYLAYPGEPVITDVSASSRDSTGKVTVRLLTNATTEHPVERVKLEVLADNAAATPDEAAAQSGWSDPGASDDGSCTALSVAVGDGIVPSPGMRTWVRVRSWFAAESVLSRYSVPVRVADLETEALSSEGGTAVAEVLSCASGDDGRSAVVRLAWNDDGATGTELSWDSDKGAWRSTDAPTTFDVTWDEGPVTVGDVSWDSSATVAIKGLTDGVPWYVAARRYLDGTVTSYGPYSAMHSVIPSVAPDGVSVDVPAHVAAGSDVTLSWTFGGGGTQRAWQVVVGGQPVESGEDARGTFTISADRAESLATGGALTLAVAVSTGGAWAQSDPATVEIVQPPSASLSAPATVTAQPVALTVASAATPDLLCTLVASGSGVSGQTPTGVETQPAGDVVWTARVSPAWVAGADGNEAAVTLPGGLDLRDGGEYALTVTPHDPATGLSGAPLSAALTVAWAHQAPDPDGAVTVAATDSTDESGVRHQSATVAMSAPDGSAATDCYDVYRMTGDGATIIGSDLPLDATVTDEYAPFGTGMDLAYRVACRTADGDVAWTDVAYELAGDAIRVDWQGGTVELPWNVAISDGYSKDVDVHEYLDGSTDALYNSGVRRSAKLSTDVIRLDEQATVDAVRALARHDGPAFVRTPDGSAYEADVQVSEMSTQGPIVAVALDCTEVRATEAFLLPPYVSEGGE